MTLFKRVFNDHTNNRAKSVPASQPVRPRSEDRAVAPPPAEPEEALPPPEDPLLEEDAFEDEDALLARFALEAEDEARRRSAPRSQPLREDASDVEAPPAPTSSQSEYRHVRRMVEDRWSIGPEESVKSEWSIPRKEAPAKRKELEADPEVQKEPVASQRPDRGGRRVRTRMLGFDAGDGGPTDPIEKAETQNAPKQQLHAVGWMAVVAGPGTGHSFALFNGVSTIGRGVGQSIQLDFGDTSISREKHAAVAYDDETGGFFLGHGGKANIVRLNNRPVLSTETLNHGDTVRIGETSLRFVALCGEDFAWGKSTDAE